MNTIHILADRLDAAQALAKKIKATLVVVRPWDCIRRTDDGLVSKVAMLELEISGPSLRVGNHTLLAKLEILDGGTALVHATWGTELDPAWRQSTGECEHCKTNRRRVHLFLLRDEDTGRVLQVGRTCLRPYLGMDTAESLLAALGFWKEVSDFEEEENRLSSSRKGYSVMEILAHTAYFAQKYGWVSKARAEVELTRPTAGWVGEALWANRPVSEEDLKTAKAIAASVEALGEPLSDFHHNVKTLVCGGYDTALPQHIAIICAAWAVYSKPKRSAPEEQPDAGWFGEPGQRVDIQATLEAVINFGISQWGDTFLHKFRTEGGQVLTWKTGRCLRGVGDKVSLRGTVKKHSEYKGRKETELARCAVAK